MRQADVGAEAVLYVCAGMMGEIELLNHLDHPNIVKYLATIKTKDYLNIVTRPPPHPSPLSRTSS